jgi:hypothetical protein
MRARDLAGFGSKPGAAVEEAGAADAETGAAEGDTTESELAASICLGLGRR